MVMWYKTAYSSLTWSVNLKLGTLVVCYLEKVHEADEDMQNAAWNKISDVHITTIIYRLGLDLVIRCCSFA